MSKQVTIIAGPNGAGKTTFARQYLQIHDLEYLSADDIAKNLAPHDLQSVQIQAGRLFFQRIARLIEAGQNFVVEVTLAGLGFQRIIQRLKRANYTVTIVFIFLESPDLCVARVQSRVRQGGHHVPQADIIRRFYRSKNNFWKVYKAQVDRWHIFYNVNQQMQEIAAGEKSHYTVSDESLFELFMSDIKTEENDGTT